MDLHGIPREIRFYLQSQYYRWCEFLYYKTQASIWMFYSLFSIIYGYITITVIYSVSSGIAGWSYYQMLLLVATTTIAYSTAWYMISPYRLVEQMRFGSIDPYLVRPYGKMTIMLALSTNQSLIGNVISGFAMLLYSAIELHVSILPFIAYIGLVAVGTFTLVVFMLMLTILAYNVMKSAESITQFFKVINNVSQYPLNIYGLAGQLLFTLVVPVGFASYYPAAAIFSKISTGSSAVTIVAAIILSIISYKLFYKLMENYTSGGG